MKMLVITAVESYQEEIVKVLKESNIHAFSSTNVLGHVNQNDPNLEDNWFGGDVQNYQSILYFALLPKEQLDNVFEAVERINAKAQSKSKIHLSVMGVERTNLN
jgi:nitrogen regulatory protein PII